ncbi:hypothetical protein MTO96_034360 [Rhipicephalus appendiculatus]
MFEKETFSNFVEKDEEEERASQEIIITVHASRTASEAAFQKEACPGHLGRLFKRFVRIGFEGARMDTWALKNVFIGSHTSTMAPPFAFAGDSLPTAKEDGRAASNSFTQQEPEYSLGALSHHRFVTASNAPERTAARCSATPALGYEAATADHHGPSLFAPNDAACKSRRSDSKAGPADHGGTTELERRPLCCHGAVTSSERERKSDDSTNQGQGHVFIRRGEKPREKSPPLPRNSTRQATRQARAVGRCGPANHCPGCVEENWVKACAVVSLSIWANGQRPAALVAMPFQRFPGATEARGC